MDPSHPVSLADAQRTLEHLPTRIYESDGAASRYVADQIAQLIRQRAEEGASAVLGLATGSTPTGVYGELVRQHREEGLSFQSVITFNLDEYYPLAPDALQSYVRYMREQLFDHVDIDPENVHVPDGTLDREAVPAYCRAYEQSISAAGGLDLQILGIGRTGHIGFNEPGSSRRSRTRLITLDEVTRADAASDFFGKENVPRRAITMGVGTILDAKRILLMAWGERKAPIVRRAVEGEVTDQVPSTFLQEHPRAEILLDEAAAAELTRCKTPWRVGYCTWDDALIRKAVVWLSGQENKPVLKLTDADYSENGMGDIVTDFGPAYNTNIQVFNDLQHTITGWPGGKPNADDTQRPERATPFPKRCLLFSPHPGDDVIAMGGTLLRLVEQGHEVHVAYQTTGSIAVFDDEALRFADFASDYQETFGPEAERPTLYQRVRRSLREKSPGDVDSDEVRALKELIRKGEAKAACRYCGVPPGNVHFLRMPFYETGRVQKAPLGEEDIQLLVDLLQDVQPHQLYAAGELTDPHGTHRICRRAIKEAVSRLHDEAWMQDCYLWLYRGAWQEWEPHEIDMAVPLSPEELDRKRGSIFKHESQKDRPRYPGADGREFWERAEERTRRTARRYDRLGLAEYEAIEGFVRWAL